MHRKGVIRTPRKIKLTLTDREAEQLRHVGVNGGFQMGEKLIHDRLNDTYTIELSDAEFGRLFRMATQYTDGGWQHAFRVAIGGPTIRSLLAKPRRSGS